MAELLLVRHGQAQSHARDAASYDSLSPLGRKQAAWLGDWLRATNGHFDRVVTGSLHRQRQTAQEMGFGTDRHEDPRWNEFDYFGLSQLMQDQHGLPFPDSPDSFATHAPQLFRAWEDERIDGAPENWPDFLARVIAALTDAAAPGGRVLVVTSGGVIGAVARHILGLDALGMSKVVLHITNASVHKVSVIDGTPFLAGFNGTAHLDHPDRAHARTYV